MDKKTLNRVLSGLADKNIQFQDLAKLLKDFGFSVRRKGDYHPTNTLAIPDRKGPRAVKHVDLRLPLKMSFLRKQESRSA